MTSATRLNVQNSGRRRILQYLIWTAAGLVIAWVAISFLAAWFLTRRPRARFEEPTPSVAWAAFKPMILQSSDDEQLGAWYSAGDATKAVILLLHGNSASRTAMLPQAEVLAKEGYGLLLVTLRAHGDSTGECNDFGYSSHHDVTAALQWLKGQAAARPVVVLAQSLGGAATLFAADELTPEVCGLILESPYRDLATAMWNRCDHYLPWGLSHVAYAGLRLSGPCFVDVGAISPERAAARILTRIPVLLLAGSKDRRAKPDEAEAIRRQLRGSCKVESFPNGDHGLLLQAEPEHYCRVVSEFIAKAVRNGQ